MSTGDQRWSAVCWPHAPAHADGPNVKLAIFLLLGELGCLSMSVASLWSGAGPSAHQHLLSETLIEQLFSIRNPASRGNW
mmetsp:Transcript_118114/g.333985  ORF Transcript_118114/g.333985 Transcript_118114/m.333985 type:complete len:80 (+) Transcript_118114:61-300(+)